MPQIVGRKAPDFALEGVLNGKFHTYRLSDYKGKWVVLFFYPLDFTFVCPTEILAFSDRLGEFRRIGAEVLGASVDSRYSHLAWTEKPREEGGIRSLAYPLLEDLKKELAEEYGVLDEAAPSRSAASFSSTPTESSSTPRSTTSGWAARWTRRFVSSRRSSSCATTARSAPPTGSRARKP